MKKFRKIREGEDKKEYLEEIKSKCFIRPDGRRTIGNSKRYFSDLVWKIIYPNDPKLEDEYIFHKDGNLLNENISNLEKINIYEHKEEYLNEIKKMCRIHKGRRIIGHGKFPFAQLVWNINNKEDMIEKGDGFQIHHIDKNSLNDDISNLCKLSSSDHTSLHNVNNKYSVGRHHPLSKIVMVEYHIFSSILQASKTFKMNRKTIRKRLDSGISGYFYIGKNNE